MASSTAVAKIQNRTNGSVQLLRMAAGVTSLGGGGGGAGALTAAAGIGAEPPA